MKTKSTPVRRLSAAMFALASCTAILPAQDRTPEPTAQTAALPGSEIRVMTLDHVLPTEVVAALESLISERVAGDGVGLRSALAGSDSRSLRLEGPPAALDQASAIIAKLDVPAEPMTILQVFELRRATSESVVAEVRPKILEEFGRAPEEAGSSSSELAGGQPERRDDASLPQIVGDPATNSVLFTGTSDEVRWIEARVLEIDGPPSTSEPESVSETPVTASRVSGFEVEVRDGVVNLRLVDPEGGDLSAFLRLSERLLGMPILYHAGEIESGQASIRFVGTMTVAEADYRSLFQSLLYVAGYTAVQHGGEKFQALEVISMSGQNRARPFEMAQSVDMEQLAELADQPGLYVVTSLRFEHLNANNVVAQTRPFFATMGMSHGRQLMATAVGDESVLVGGPASQVFAAIQLLRTTDLKPRER